MALTDTAIKNTKPTDKPMRLADERGLYLSLNPNGSCWWRFDYRSGDSALDLIERQLAHAENNAVRAAYSRAEYLPERKKMMQQWADYLDKSELLQIKLRGNAA
ncbi:MAG: integrase family protein [Sterolibacterium sp.]|nr:integrase family protein [Sterolibacterium sp.]